MCHLVANFLILRARTDLRAIGRWRQQQYLVRANPFIIQQIHAMCADEYLAYGTIGPLLCIMNK